MMLSKTYKKISAAALLAVAYLFMFSGGAQAACTAGYCGGDTGSRYIAFIIDAPNGGDLDTMAGADATCQSIAVANGMSGRYKAWLADSNPMSAPLYRFNNVGTSLPFYMTNGTKLVDNWADLVDGTVDNALSRRADGTTDFFIAAVLSNVATNGTRKSATSHCADWTANNGDSVNIGHQQNTDATWTDYGSSTCNAGIHVYCFEQNVLTCSNPTGNEGDVLYNNSDNVLQWCDGSTWRAFTKSGNPSGTNCSNPSGSEGDIRYNGDDHALQWCGAGVWHSVGIPNATGGLSTDPCSGSPSAGDQCGDGTVYAGISPDGSLPMYVTALDSPTALSWNNGSTSYTVTGVTNATDGDGNTTTLAGLADAGAPYAAAVYCQNLNAHGHTDWYLPAQNEVNVIVAGENISTLAASFWPNQYRSSTEVTNSAEYVIYSDGTGGGGQNKDTAGSVRCARKSASYTSPGYDPLTADLLGYWPLDEGTGTSTADSSGYGYNGTLQNGPTWITGHDGTGYAVRFNMGNEQIALSYANGLNLADEITISAWIRPETAGENGFGGIISRVSNDGWDFQMNGGNQSVNMWSSNTTDQPSNTNSITYNVWQHVAAVVDNGTLTFYVNGAEAGSMPWTLVTESPLTLAFIGATGNNIDNFDGDIDEVRVYGRAFTEPEIRALYDQASACSNPSGAEGSIIYNERYKTPQYCNGSTWVSAGRIYDPCTATSPTAGTVCLDGSVYVAATPDGDRPMMTTRCNRGQNWNGSICTGTAWEGPWNNGNGSGYVDTAAESFDAGQGNTAILAATDSDSATGGTQPHQAAQYCADLVENGYDDWYLPAWNELDLIFDRRSYIGNFENVCTASSYVWSSSDYGADTSSANVLSDDTGVVGQSSKNWTRCVRCVRKMSCDDTPNAFSFTDVTAVNRKAAVSSNIIQITGLGCPATVWVTGSATATTGFRICADAACSTVIRGYDSEPTSIANGQYIDILHQSSGSANSQISTVVHIGPSGTTDTFTSTTADYKVVFVTSTTYNGAMGGAPNGVTRADTNCSTLATAAGLGGTYKAWLAQSAATQPSTSFTQSVLDYKMLDPTATTVANGWTDLTDGTIDNAITIDEGGVTRSAANNVWTNVNTNGTLETDANTSDCTNWSSSANAAGGEQGSSNSATATWSTGAAANCNGTKRLYCFEQ